ncbi:MAG: SDR family NAD(P)-dependent oxidoreductase, partial [Myxococcales bacterium]
MREKPDFGEESYRGHGRLENRVALITGADSGIGRAVALAFAREGADIVIGYLNEHEDARETQRVVEAAGRRALLVPGDLADAATAQDLVAKTMERFGRLDTLVINAVHQGKSLDKFED